MHKVQIDLTSINRALEGLEPNGQTQKFFTSELMRLSDPYVPNDGAGVLAASARMTNDGTAIVYSTPYARYQWYGKLMVDPFTGKGAFYKEGYGFWSRPNTPKVLTDIDLHYQGAPLRGSHWVERAFIDHKDELIQSTKEYIKRQNK